MAFGLSFYGANNQLIFDTSLTSATADVLNPYHFNSSGALTIGSNTTSSAITILDTDLLFVRVDSGNLRGVVTYSTVNNVDYKTFTPSQSTDYFIARATTAVTSNLVSSDYGLEVYDTSSPQKTTFSTRKADSSINVEYVFDDLEVTHNQQIWSSSTAGVYVSVGHMWTNNSNGTWACFNYGTNSITFDSFLNLGIFGTASIPNFGSLVIASIRGE